MTVVKGLSRTIADICSIFGGSLSSPVDLFTLTFFKYLLTSFWQTKLNEKGSTCLENSFIFCILGCSIIISYSIYYFHI